MFLGKLLVSGRVLTVAYCNPYIILVMVMPAEKKTYHKCGAWFGNKKQVQNDPFMAYLPTATRNINQM